MAHNLITFKSHHEALDDWALKELTGHFVNYRKQVSPSVDDLHPESDFQLYAVCSRQPHNLAARVPLQQIQPGVYDCQRGTDRIRVIVVAGLPQTAKNASLHLFSASEKQVEFGARQYRQRSEDTSSVLTRLFESYLQEGGEMSTKLKQFVREFLARPSFEVLKVLTPQQRLEGLTPEERVAGLTDEQLVQLLEQRRQQSTPPQPKKAPKKQRKS